MKFWKWVKGRQAETEYKKFPLFSFRIWRWGFDGYILKYAPNTVLDWHTDPVKNGEHWRRNWTLKGISVFYYTDNKTTHYRYSEQGSIWFRPDICKHKLEVYNEGCTKLSLGFVKFN